MKQAKRTHVERGLYKKGSTYYACATPQGKRSPTWRSLGVVNLSTARRLRDEFVSQVRADKIVTSQRSFAEVASDWLTQQERLRDIGELRSRTFTGYEGSMRLHVAPFFGQRLVKSVTADDLVEWQRWARTGEGQGFDKQGKSVKRKPQSDWAVRKHWMALRLCLGYAHRHGFVGSNPADSLTQREKPKPGKNRVRFLDSDEIKAFLSAVPERYKLAVELDLFTGLRLGELLGLRWRDIDLSAGVLNVTGQLDENGKRVEYGKTDASHREVILMGGLTTRLKAHKLASKFSSPNDLVLSSEKGTAMNPRNVAQRGLEVGVTGAGLESVTFHVLRHTFASILIFQGHDVIYVAAQLGHEKPSITLDTYSHLFGRARNAEKHRSALDAEFGHLFA